jgi:hypothetical protein
MPILSQYREKYAESVRQTVETCLCAGKVGSGRAAELLLIKFLGSIDYGCALGGSRLGEDVSARAGEGTD